MRELDPYFLAGFMKVAVSMYRATAGLRTPVYKAQPAKARATAGLRTPVYKAQPTKVSPLPTPVTVTPPVGGTAGTVPPVGGTAGTVPAGAAAAAGTAPVGAVPAGTAPAARAVPAAGFTGSGDTATEGAAEWMNTGAKDQGIDLSQPNAKPLFKNTVSSQGMYDFMAQHHPSSIPWWTRFANSTAGTIGQMAFSWGLMPKILQRMGLGETASYMAPMVAHPMMGRYFQGKATAFGNKMLQGVH